MKFLAKGTRRKLLDGVALPATARQGHSPLASGEQARPSFGISRCLDTGDRDT